MQKVKLILNEWAGLFALIGIFVGGFWYQGNKIDNLTVMVYNEMRDFHGRMERLDERFTNHIERCGK